MNGEWCKRGVNVGKNPRKTIAIPFTRKRKLILVDSAMCGVTVEFSKETKNLLVVLDSKFSIKIRKREGYQNSKVKLNGEVVIVADCYPKGVGFDSWVMLGNACKRVLRSTARHEKVKKEGAHCAGR
jgi:hypothetical protein